MNNGQEIAKPGSVGANCKQAGKLSARTARLDITSPCERLDYVADMLQALRAISAQAKCQTLTNLLDMAYHEAVERARFGQADGVAD
jgi:hypothetical protein